MTLLEALNSEIDTFFELDKLGLKHDNRKAFRGLCDKQPSLDGGGLIRRLQRRITDCVSDKSPARGAELWRWKKNPNLGSNNDSLEVRIERAIAKLLDCNWVNQVPAASGLTKANDKRCSVDIVHRQSEDEFDFIELKALENAKVSSGQQTPLFASMEILKYGLLLHYCKQHRKSLFPRGIENKPILKATRIHLEVLMTPNCYLDSTKAGPFRIAWLNQLIADGLTHLNRQRNSSLSGNEVQFDFSFKRFPESFHWSDADHNTLLNSPEGSTEWNQLRERISEAMEKRELV